MEICFGMPFFVLKTTKFAILAKICHQNPLVVQQPAIVPMSSTTPQQQRINLNCPCPGKLTKVVEDYKIQLCVLKLTVIFNMRGHFFGVWAWHPNKTCFEYLINLSYEWLINFGAQLP